LALETGDTGKVSQALNERAWVQWYLGNYPAGCADAQEAQRSAKIVGNVFREGVALQIEGICFFAMGNYRPSIFALKRARHLLSLCGMSDGEKDRGIMGSQAEIHLLKSEYVDAYDIQTRLRDITMDRSVLQHGIAILTIIQIDLELNTPVPEVRRNLEKAESLFTTMNFSIGTTWCEIFKGALHLREGDLLAAQTLFQANLKLTWGKDVDAVSYCLAGLADRRNWDTPDLTWPMIFIVHSLKWRRQLEIHKALQFLGHVYLLYGDLQTATSLLTVALESFTQMDVHRSRAECMLQLGEISQLRGDRLKAEDLWKGARPLFERASQANQIAHIDERLARISQLQSARRVT
jgi:tetratricopeptide (TPR) repeat protein